MVIAGDEIVVRDPITGACGPRIPHDAVNAQPARSRESLVQLEGLEADTLLAGHGDPWRGSMGDAVARAREADAD